MLRQWRYRDHKGCGKLFTVKTDTIMHDSKLPLSKWCIAYFLYSTNLEGVSSMKLHRDLKIALKLAWHMAHRIRTVLAVNEGNFFGPVEMDDIYISGRGRNKHESQKLKQGRGAAGKAPVVGLKERDTGKASAEVVPNTKKSKSHGFVKERTGRDSVVYADEYRSYEGLPRPHLTVMDSVKQFVNGKAHTNGFESFWATLKSGYKGVFHDMNAKHLRLYVSDFEGRHDVRLMGTEYQMASIFANGIDRRLTCANLIGEPHTRQPELL